MQAILKKSKTHEGNWRRWISGGALGLALVGHLVPATANAMIDIGEEVIEIEDTAPWTPPNWGGHAGGGAPNGTPGGDSGGGGGGGGGGGSIPSGGGNKPKPSQSEKRLANAKQDCLVLEGVWDTAVFKDIDTQVAFAGYSCRIKYPDGTYTWLYYDSKGYLNQRCNGTLEVQTL